MAVALGAPDAEPPAGERFPERAYELSTKPLCSTFARVSRLYLDNSMKEGLWRLVYNAAPCPFRILRDAQTPCAACGSIPQDRTHLFWSCLMAQHLRALIGEHLASRGLPSDVSREQLWLQHPPHKCIAPPVWTVVCTLFLHCCLYGSKRLYFLQRRDSPFAPERLCRHIETIFWARLRQYFCDLVSIANHSLDGKQAKPLEALISSLQTAEKDLPPNASLPFVVLQEGHLLCVFPS